MSEKKPCPVDRGKLLIGLEVCRSGKESLCPNCPYSIHGWKCTRRITKDALAYIYWLEEQNDIV